MVQLFESSEAAKDKALVKAIELLMKKSAEHKDDLTVMANYAKELHGQYLNKVQDPRVLTNAMSVAYASANLYSNPDNAGKLLGVSGGSTVIKEIDWNKVAWCDVIGSMVGPEGSAIASLCSIINQS